MADILFLISFSILAIWGESIPKPVPSLHPRPIIDVTTSTLGFELHPQSESQRPVLPLKERNYYLRVGLIREARQLAFKTEGEFNIQSASGESIARLPDGCVFYADLTPEDREGGKLLVHLKSADGILSATDPALLRLAPANPKNRILIFRHCLDKGRRYAGVIDLALNEKSMLTAINTVWLEYFLHGAIVANENDSLEYLKAEAVIARTEAVYLTESGSKASELFDFDTALSGRVFRGMADEPPLLAQAINSTRGEILVNEGRVVPTDYNSFRSESQTFARQTNGIQYRQILAHQFKNVMIRRLYF